jgi:hypothetical protein
MISVPALLLQVDGHIQTMWASSVTSISIHVTPAPFPINSQQKKSISIKILPVPRRTRPTRTHTHTKRSTRMSPKGKTSKDDAFSRCEVKCQRMYARPSSLATVRNGQACGHVGGCGACMYSHEDLTLERTSNSNPTSGIIPQSHHVLGLIKVIKWQLI